MVPELPTATSKPSRSTSRASGASIGVDEAAAGVDRAGCTRSVRKNRRVRRMAPSLKLRTARISLRSADQDLGAAAADVDHEHGGGRTPGRPGGSPRWIRRASSMPEITSTSTPASRRARSRKSSAFSASRTALVATAVTRAVGDVGHLAEAGQRRDAPVDGVGRRAASCRRRPSRGGRPPSRRRSPRSGRRRRSAPRPGGSSWCRCRWPPGSRPCPAEPTQVPLAPNRADSVQWTKHATLRESRRSVPSGQAGGAQAGGLLDLRGGGDARRRRSGARAAESCARSAPTRSPPPPPRHRPEHRRR